MKNLPAFQHHMPVKINFETETLLDLTQFQVDNDPKFSTLLVVSKSVGNIFSELFLELPDNFKIYSEVKKNPALIDIADMPILENCNRIIGIGGGSVMDSAKACFARLITRDSYPLKDLITKPELIASAKNSRQDFNFTLVPTTFGTSSELTSWGTVWDWQNSQKLSISSPLLYPDQALIHPRLSDTLPGYITAYTGLDTLSHAMESYWNRNSTPISRIYCLEAIKYCVATLPQLVDDLANKKLRNSIAIASILAGMAFSQTKTSTAHALSYPLTLQHNIAHGFACSITLGEIFNLNNKTAPELMAPILNIFQENMETSNDNFAEIFKSFLTACRASTKLGDYGVKKENITNLAKAAYLPKQTNSMLYQVNEEEIAKVYRAVL
ncbi:MAG: iron-containing alcohol dehydrogenase [Magnetococcales bacterium]|nr:iron-containing alcohol dehydrogenase [Magnetococcales bacterium]